MLVRHTCSWVKVWRIFGDGCQSFPSIIFLFDPSADNDDEVSTERNMAAVSPIPKIVTTPIKDDYSRDEKEDHADEWGKTSVDQSDDRPWRCQISTK